MLLIACFDVEFLPELVLRCYCELRGFPLALDRADRSFAHVKKDKPAVLAVRFCIILCAEPSNRNLRKQEPLSLPPCVSFGLFTSF